MSCGQKPDDSPGPPAAAQLSGTMTLAGLQAPVRVTRDRWGVPHIKAESQNDLFFAQGFVQAQDRLFQMDLWHRSTQGRLSEVLGPNFIDRDAMTRRIQYRGDLDAEWASYGADTKAIATAFTRGINAQIRLMGQRVPEAFRLAGWTPELWRPEDLLSRTDAFLASGDAQDEVFRAQLVLEVGAARASALVGRPLEVPRGLDLKTISPIVGDNLKRVGAPPFFSGFAAPFDAGRGSNAWAVAHGDRGTPLLAADPHVPLESPSLRYLVHLEAPGWNVIGATFPWMPGVAIGHNERAAWAMTAFNADTQDLYVERVNPGNPHQVAGRSGWIDLVAEKESVHVKGRTSYDYERLYSPHGVVIALDSQRHLAFTVQWTGFQPGAAGELASLALDRAASLADIEAALDRWKMPAAEFVYATADGHVGRRVSGLTPIRRTFNGALPVPAERAEYEWSGAAADTIRSTVDPLGSVVASANGSLARMGRIADVLHDPAARSADDFKQLQQDVLAWNAQRLVPLLTPLRAPGADVEAARQALVQWDKRISAASQEAALYVTWERLLLRKLVAMRVPDALVDAFVTRAAASLVPAIVSASPVWFDAGADRTRDSLLLTSLVEAIEEEDRDHTRLKERTWGSLHTVTFVHPLGITDQARQRFNLGPIETAGYAETVLSIANGRGGRSVGPALRGIFDAGDWDRSLAINAPGQSEFPSSAHFADLVKPWSEGEYVPLAFSDQAVQEHAESTLLLTPK